MVLSGKRGFFEIVDLAAGKYPMVRRRSESKVSSAGGVE